MPPPPYVPTAYQVIFHWVNVRARDVETGMSEPIASTRVTNDFNAMLAAGFTFIASISCAVIPDGLGSVNILLKAIFQK